MFYLIFFVSLLQRFVLKDSGSVRYPDPLDEITSLGCGSQGCHQSRSRPASKQSDLWGVASEVIDVQLDPLQGRHDVAEAIIAGGWGVGPLGERVQREEAEDAAAVVDADEHHAVVLGQGWNSKNIGRSFWAHFKSFINKQSWILCVCLLNRSKFKERLNS